MDDVALSVLVVSDLHATSRPEGDGAGSWLTTTTARSPTTHPLVGLQKRLNDDGEHPDLILCAGDITDKSDATALIYAWRELNELAENLGSQLIATAGNHDLDSRHNADLDPRGVMFDLEPFFPAGDELTRDQYWSRNYAIIDGPTNNGQVAWRVVTLNSCAFHGYTGDSGPELEHGRISAKTTERLRLDLARLPEAAINIALLHHHVEQLPDVDLAERSQLREAQQFVTLLESTASWLVIHGHKHRPYLMYAHGSANSATIFSAGSMSSYPYGQTGATEAPRNQAYLLRFGGQQTLETLGVEVAGRFSAWNWGPTGWQPAAMQSGLPGLGGFGARGNPIAVARRLARQLSVENLIIDRPTLLATEPSLEFFIPADLEIFKSQLARGNPAAVCQFSEHGELLQISMTVDLDQIAEIENELPSTDDESSDRTD